MHINSDRLIESLTEVELMHINNCTQCASERKKLMALKVSANQLDVIHPPQEAWETIKARLPIQKKAVSHFKRYVFSSAASLFFVAVGWLVWSNYSLQHQLQEVLLVNMMLEDKVNMNQQVTFQQATLVEALRKLDSELYQAHSTKQKLMLLQKRRELIQQHLAKPQGNNDEFSI